MLFKSLHLAIERYDMLRSFDCYLADASTDVKAIRSREKIYLQQVIARLRDSYNDLMLQLVRIKRMIDDEKQRTRLLHRVVAAARVSWNNV